MSTYRGRFAPSPTGRLHLGGAATALCAWLAARAARGRFVLRVEDLDRPRVVAGSLAEILDDLRWLGLDWDEGPEAGGETGPLGPYVQSERVSKYEAALGALDAAGLVYPCDCSRAEIARVASAPHAGEDGPIYPGTCASAPRQRTFRRAPAMRFRVPPEVVRFVDRVHGAHEVDVRTDTGDFVLRRGDGIFAYQMAVVVDDLTMGITEVVRGADLLGSTARQVALARALGAAPPAFAHAPLVLGPSGDRLAKRARGVAVRDHREAGCRAGTVVSLLARILGLENGDWRDLRPQSLVDAFSWERVRREPVRVDAERLRLG